MELNALPHFRQLAAAGNSLSNAQQALIDLCIQVQQIPAPTGDEKRRADWVADYLTDLGLADVRQDDLYNVYARIPGQAPGPALMVSAHTDTVFPQETDLSVSQPNPHSVAGPGIGDNSAGVAGLLALAQLLKDLPPTPVDIWLVANSNEEGLGDLKGMRAAVAHLQEQAGQGLGAAIVIEGMGLGRVVHQALGVRRYRLHVTAPGGHSWGDFGTASAVHALVILASEIARMKMPKEPRTSFNIGVIQGGRTVNTIAQEASLDLDLRSVDPAMLNRVDDHVLDLVRRHQQQHDRAKSGVTIRAEVIGNRPAGEIPGDHPMVQGLGQILRHLEIAECSDVHISSTDANIPLSQGIPAICIGLTEGGDAHRLSEWIDTRPLAQGVQQLLYFTWWTAHWLTRTS